MFRPVSKTKAASLCLFYDVLPRCPVQTRGIVQDARKSYPQNTTKTERNHQELRLQRIMQGDFWPSPASFPG